MSNVIISSSITVPYSFTDDKGKEVNGENYYVMVSNGGSPRIEKAATPLLESVEIDSTRVCYDYKKRLIVKDLNRKI